MIKYIDAEKLKILISRQEKMAKSLNDNLCASYMEIAKRIVDDMPTADVEEVRHGKWVKDKSKKRDDGEIYDYCCSRCCGLAGKNDYNNYSILSAYCPHCGAKMDGE